MKELTVLYVEDEEMIREPFAMLLAKRVESLFTAQDGTEGLRAFIACQPDLVITDISMPGMDGLQMAAHIRDIQPAVPIVFVTASPKRLAEFERFDPSIDRVLTKPVDFCEFAGLLESYASAKRSLPVVCCA